MKIKIKIPDDGLWPSDYRGRAVVVEVTSIVFENNMHWSVVGLSNPELVDDDSAPKKTLDQNFYFGGQRVKDMTISFEESK